MADYTAAEKLKEIEREIAMRVRHYPAMIAKGTLSLTSATRQCDILREIANDYRTAAPRESENDALAVAHILK